MLSPAKPGESPPGTERSAAVEKRLRADAAAAGLEGERWVNRLVREQSPYLLQHAGNPVDWRPWGEEAFAKAKQLDRPIFLSIGYSTCHWCHVMAHESFEDPEIAALINARYVPVKVDREERPDVDEVYMAAVQALNRGRGGWPMTLVLTPRGEPVFAATYLPARDGDRGSRRGLEWILTRIADDWDHNRSELLGHATEITQHLTRLAAPQPPGDVPGLANVERGVTELMNTYDAVNHGFGGAPKFPRPVTLDLLLQAPDPRPEPVQATLRAMFEGGLHDPLAGGFHRYSVDEGWQVPHFEKMLYDNAQLLGAATDAWQATHEPRLRVIAERTAAYLLTDLRLPSGGFASATDADSLTAAGELEEGAFYTWTPAEVRAALPDPADQALALDVLGITEEGELDGRAVPSLTRWPTAEEQPRWARVARRLREVRAERPPPSLDDKVVTAWNAYAISALARAALAFGEPSWAEAASQAADLVLDKVVTAEGRLLRTLREGTARHPAVLEDEAAMAVAAVDLFETTLEPRWLGVAQARLEVLEAHFADPRGGWFRTAEDGEALLVRPRDDYEAAEPSGTALAVEALLRVAHLTGAEAPRKTADRALAAYSRTLDRAPTAMPLLLAQVARRHAPEREVVVVWPEGANAEPLRAVVRAAWLPHAERLFLPEPAVAGLASIVPWVEGKVAQRGQPTAYVCEGGVCLQPATTAEELAEALATSGASEE